MLRQAFGRDLLPPSHPRSRRLTLALPLQAFELRPPRALLSRVLPPSSPSSPPMRCPGFGAPALPSGLGLEALASALAIARDDGVSASGRRWPPCLRCRGNLLACQVPRRGHLPEQRHPRGSNRVGEEGRANEELSESPGQGHEGIKHADSTEVGNITPGRFRAVPGALFDQSTPRGHLDQIDPSPRYGLEAGIHLAAPLGSFGVVINFRIPTAAGTPR